MGHIVNPEHEYRILQQRLGRMVQGAPESPTLVKILRLLFSPEDAELALHLPHNLTSVETLAQALKIPVDELDDRLTDMARRGLVFDIEHKGKRLVTLPPVVIGFFEYPCQGSQEKGGRSHGTDFLNRNETLACGISGHKK